MPATCLLSADRSPPGFLEPFISFVCISSTYYHYIYIYMYIYSLPRPRLCNSFLTLAVSLNLSRLVFRFIFYSYSILRPPSIGLHLFSGGVSCNWLGQVVGRLPLALEITPQFLAASRVHEWTRPNRSEARGGEIEESPTWAYSSSDLRAGRFGACISTTRMATATTTPFDLASSTTPPKSWTLGRPSYAAARDYLVTSVFSVHADIYARRRGELYVVIAPITTRRCLLRRCCYFERAADIPRDDLWTLDFYK